MPKARLQRQKSAQGENQVQSERLNNTRISHRWRVAILLLATIIGGVIGYFSLPGHLRDIVTPGYSLSVEGVQVFAVLGGSGVCLLLVIWLGAVIAHEEIRKSRRALFWCSAGIFAVAIVGAILGYMYLPGVLLAPIRVFFGAIIALVVLVVLIDIIQDPKAAFSGLLSGCLEGFLGGCLEGCLSFLCVFFIALIGMVSGLLIWHTLLLGVLTIFI